MGQYWVPECLADLEHLVSNRVTETSSLEFKRELPPTGKNDDLLKDVCAMANSGGGVILYGVDERDGLATGLSPLALAGVKERVTQAVKTGVDEPPVVKVDPLTTGPNLGYLVVAVEDGRRAPHFVTGVAYGRAGATVTRLRRRDIGHLFARSEGFAQEFGLALERPGRVVVKTETRPIAGAHGRDSFIVFVNDGGQATWVVAWRWLQAEGGIPRVHGAPESFALNPGAEITFRVQRDSGTADHLVLEVMWADAAGRRHVQAWPTYWA